MDNLCIESWSPTARSLSLSHVFFPLHLTHRLFTFLLFLFFSFSPPLEKLSQHTHAHTHTRTQARKQDNNIRTLGHPLKTMQSIGHDLRRGLNNFNPLG